jgi:type IV pilus assembly protein PilC
MKHDEFAFFNQQLAAMLRDGIPLEGALKQLCAGMQSGPLRAELQKLEADLAAGTPLKDALARRDLPDFYKRMVEIGARSNDLPGVLTLLADHYQRINALWTRLKGLMVYPALVVAVSLGVTVLLSLIFTRLLKVFYETIPDFGNSLLSHRLAPNLMLALIWMPSATVAVFAALCILVVSVPRWRARLGWFLPAFREASLAQLASAVALMLKNGVTLPDALALAEALEPDTPAAKVFARWRSMVAAGQGKPLQWPADNRPIPPLFVWLVQNGGEDAADGFQKAADIYQGRASYKIEMMLYGALPSSIMLLGMIIFWQMAPLAKSFISLLGPLTDMN